MVSVDENVKRWQHSNVVLPVNVSSVIMGIGVHIVAHR
jgi:hypothetical protein